MKQCPFCQEEIQDTAIKCRYCGEWLNKQDQTFSNKKASNEEKTIPPPPPLAQDAAAIPPLARQEEQTIQFSGFWKRVAAFLIDSIIVIIGAIPIFLILGLLFIRPTGNDVYNEAQWSALAGSVGVIFTWIYYISMEISSYQGTVGKILLKIKVTDLKGRKIGFGKATGRTFGKCISGIFCIGYLMVAYTKKKQGLHDIMAGCLVVNRVPETSVSKEAEEKIAAKVVFNNLPNPSRSLWVMGVIGGIILLAFAGLLFLNDNGSRARSAAVIPEGFTDVTEEYVAAHPPAPAVEAPAAPAAPVVEAPSPSMDFYDKSKNKIRGTFDVEGALAAGVSKKEIADTLAYKAHYNIAGARRAGFTDDEIISELTSTVNGPSAKVNSQGAPYPQSQNLAKVADAMLANGCTYRETANFLAEQTKFNIVNARADGYSDKEIIEHLKKNATLPSVNLPQVEKGYMWVPVCSQETTKK